MKIGIIADSHLGIDGVQNKQVIQILDRISRHFKESDVNQVLHIGDMVSEKDPNIQENIETITNVFSDFDKRYISFGNHDRVAINKSQVLTKGSVSDNYNWDYNEQVIYDTDDTSAIILDSSFESQYDNIGYISDKSFTLLEEQLETKDKIHIFTHYPPDKIAMGNVAFEYIPERKYPVNKLEFYELQEKYDTTIKIHCGHIHPQQTQTETGKMTNVPITAYEPVMQFDIDEETNLVNISNTTIELNDLIVEIGE